MTFFTNFEIFPKVDKTILDIIFKHLIPKFIGNEKPRQRINKWKK
jgi:hypothetical protein